MNVNRKLSILTTLTLLALTAAPNLAAPQKLSSLKANAHGQGTLTIGREVLKVNTVIVELNEDGTGELTLVTDLTLFVSCTWTAPTNLSKGIELTITGGTTASGAQGAGKLMLKADGKSIASLTVQGSSNTEKRKIQLNFLAD
jgi:hypothetical protein